MNSASQRSQLFKNTLRRNRTAPAPTDGAGSRPSGGTIGEKFLYYLRQEKKEMEIETAIWNGKKTKVIAVETFNSSKEALDFLKEIQNLDKEASLSVIAVRKGK